MRRDERGATAVVVALLLVPLLGLGALVIDTGALYQEKRELQNGADAAALAVARDCAGPSCGAATATAGLYADANANDGDSNVDEVCGLGPGLAACLDPPAVPAGAQGYVRVTASTRDGDRGTNEVTYGLARVITNQTGETVRARSVVAWGSPGAKITTQLTISRCEFDSFTDPLGLGLRVFGVGPPFLGLPKTVFFHGSGDAGNCPAGPSGADLPGGFGWLDSVDCGALISAGSWVSDKTGNSVPTDCHPSQWQNKTILLPIYDDTNGLSGSNGSYHVAGFAAFHVVGYRFPSEKWPSNVKCTLLDDSSSTCLKGFFTKYVTSADVLGGPGSDFGAVAVVMTG